MTSTPQQLWIELPPIEGEHPKRLMFFLHGFASRPESFAPVAIAWQLKFPSATAFVLQAPLMSAPKRFHWFDANASAQTIRQTADRIAQTIRQVQAATGIGAEQSFVVGFSQGATLALELSRLSADQPIASVYVTYAAQLNGAILADEKIQAQAIHLLHGELDSVVTMDKAKRAFEQLKRANVNVTLDLLEDGTHGIDQDGIIIGTTRAMQSVFKGRRKPALVNRALH